MHYLSVILLGIAANLDNLAIGMVYGLRGIRLPFPSNLVMALLSGLAIYISGWCGQLLTQVMPDKTANLLGGMIVALLGAWVIWAYWRDQEKYKIFPIQCDDDDGMAAIFKHPEKADMDNSGDISWQEALALGLALAANCLTMGVGVGITGLNLAWVALAVTLSSLLAITIGLFLGHRYGSSFLGTYATPAAGLILILVGIYEMLI